MPRFMSSGATPARLEMGLALILTCRGIPCVYYGTEQYLHNDTNGGAGGYNYTIATNVPANDGYAGLNWNGVPNTVASSAKIKVADKDASYVNGTSPTFHIVGSVRVDTPNGGQRWEILTSSNNIIWYSKGVSNVKLYYSTNGGGSYTFIKSNPTVDGGNQTSWSIPAVCTAQGKINITDASNEAVVFDESDGLFNLTERFGVTQPTNGTVLVAIKNFIQGVVDHQVVNFSDPCQFHAVAPASLGQGHRDHAHVFLATG